MTNIYQEKSTKIEAVRLWHSGKSGLNVKEIEEFIGMKMHEYIYDKTQLVIPQTGHPRILSVGEYVIKRHNGFIDVMTAEHFKNKYELFGG